MLLLNDLFYFIIVLLILLLLQIYCYRISNSWTIYFSAEFDSRKTEAQVFLDPSKWNNY